MRWNASERFEPTPGPASVAWPDLHVCRHCERPFVVATTVLDVVGHDRYLVELRCMDCSWRAVSVEGEVRLEALDRELDRQMADIAEAAGLMELTRRIDEIDAFAGALRDGLVLPEDF
jgi:hypothetical protein